MAADATLLTDHLPSTRGSALFRNSIPHISLRLRSLQCKRHLEPFVDGVAAVVVAEGVRAAGQMTA